MRRLLSLLIAMMVLAAFAQPSQARGPAPRLDNGMTMPARDRHDEGQCARHVCLGCAIRPAESPAPTPALPIAGPPAVAALAALAPNHRPGFDPPPPRPIG